MGDTWSASFLRTRVARRILGLFLLCAILPVTGLAVLGYHFVASQLQEDAEQDLRAQSKTAGLILIDRLTSLAASLERRSNELGDGYRYPAVTSIAAVCAARFSALVLQRRDGTAQTLSGEMATFPVLSRTEDAYLRAGGITLALDTTARPPRVYLVRRVDRVSGARLWGQVDPASVWGAEESHSPAPPGTLLCLATAQRQPIACTDQGALTALGDSSGGATSTWTHRGVDYLAGRWTIFLGRMYGAPSWTIMLSRAADEIFAPLATLRRTFILGILLALALVFTLSHIHLRRTMTPLEALDAGTRRLAQGNFTEPVRVDSRDEFEGLAASFNSMTEELQRQFRTQQALQEVGRAALEAEGPETVLAALFARSRTLLGPGELSVALSRPDDPFWWRALSASAHAAGSPPHDLHPDPAELEELLAHPEGFVVHRGAGGRSYFVPARAELERDAVVLPLLRKGVLGGAIVLDCEMDGAPAQVALDRARRFADPIGVALVNTQLLDQLEALNLGALTALARAIDAVSPWTAGHSERVTVGALEIGRRLGLSESDLDLLNRGGLLHDVGKVGIPSALLDKPGKLTPEEYETVKGHPAIGVKILAPIGAFHAVLPLVLHHHEMLDGSGYPHGLAGDQIPLLVRIMTVADVFDALTSERPYRAAWPADQALAYLRESAGSRFDARAVEALAASIDAGWRPVAQGRPLELPDLGSAHRFSLWPETDRTRGVAAMLPELPLRAHSA